MFRTDLHIDLLGQSAEQNCDSIALCTHAWLRVKLERGMHTVQAGSLTEK